MIDLLTLNATRTARGFHTGFELPGRIYAANGEDSHAIFYTCSQVRQPWITDRWNHLLHLAGWTSADQTAKTMPSGDKKVISMNWWLSPPVQQYLDAEVCGEQNRKAENSAWRSIGSVLEKAKGQFDPARACPGAK